jgi:preprotein translocase SecE subunit
MLRDLKKFLNEVWREVRPGKGLVTWPSLESVRQSTFVVILSTVMLSGFIAACDFGLAKLRVWMLG